MYPSLATNPKATIEGGPSGIERKRLLKLREGCLAASYRLILMGETNLCSYGLSR